MNNKDDYEAKREDVKPALMPIKTIKPECLNQISADGAWEKVELAADSGAT